MSSLLQIDTPYLCHIDLKISSLTAVTYCRLELQPVVTKIPKCDNEAVIYLNFGTPKNNEFSIWNKWKINYFQVSQYLSTLRYFYFSLFFLLFFFNLPSTNCSCMKINAWSIRFSNFGESMFICLITPCFTVKLRKVITNLIQNGFP